MVYRRGVPLERVDGTLRQNEGKSQVKGMSMSKKVREKPAAYRLDAPDGRVVLLGVPAAARWLGLSKTTVRKIARGLTAEYSDSTVERVRDEFPALFRNCAV
jgi:hypothetical protein